MRIHNIAQSLLIVISFLIGVGNSLDVDCIYNPSNFSVTSKMPLNPLMNCREYCQEYYAETPQRYYYNVSSNMCEPMRYCNSSLSYYDYNTNQCYTNQSKITLAGSYIQASSIGQSINVNSPNMQLVCKNGVYNLLKMGGSAYCLCNLLWEDSGLVDMKGFPMKCDKVTTNPAGFFSNQLTTTANGTITNYGDFTAAQIQIILSNMRELQAMQQKQYILNQTGPILYMVSKYTKMEPIIRQSEYLVAIFVLIGIWVILGASYWQYEKLRIKITEKELKQKIVAALSEQNMLKQIE